MATIPKNIPFIHQAGSPLPPFWRNDKKPFRSSSLNAMDHTNKNLFFFFVYIIGGKKNIKKEALKS